MTKIHLPIDVELELELNGVDLHVTGNRIYAYLTIPSRNSTLQIFRNLWAPPLFRAQFLIESGMQIHDECLQTQLSHCELPRDIPELTAVVQDWIYAQSL